MNKLLCLLKHSGKWKYVADSGRDICKQTRTCFRCGKIDFRLVHDWEDYGYRHDPNCPHCHGKGEYTEDYSYSGPGSNVQMLPMEAFETQEPTQCYCQIRLQRCKKCKTIK